MEQSISEYELLLSRPTQTVFLHAFISQCPPTQLFFTFPQAMDQSTSDYDREKLQERLAKLSGGVAVLKVGLVLVMCGWLGPTGGWANGPGWHSNSAAEQHRSKEDTEDCRPPAAWCTLYAAHWR